ncbi:MAG: D-tyrosyl-tRNA(Tyr) deacylase [Lachnospiraceae bacterium]|nr:D-tyrosyl-tRNA(Tyr) deacylase [Lachnospiraceae bacterium]
MRAVVTRVKEASVTIDGVVKGKIDKGLMVLLGVHKDDDEEKARWVADRICGLRIFEDEQGKMNINPQDAGASILIISQFTLYADISSRRPGFSDAARPDTAIPLYELVIKECKDRGFDVETGEFGADMQVMSVNDGPVTIVVEK